MGISDPILNCVTQVCCGFAAAQKALAGELVKQGCPPAVAKKCAEYLHEYFDLLPKGTVNLEKVIELARQPRASEADMDQA